MDSPRSKRIRHMYSTVAGVGYEGRQRVARKLATGDRLSMKHQPDNPHDKWAAALLTSKKEHVGYVPSDLAGEMVRKQTAGTRLDFLVTNASGEVVDLAIVISVEGVTDEEVTEYVRANNVLDRPQRRSHNDDSVSGCIWKPAIALLVLLLVILLLAALKIIRI